MPVKLNGMGGFSSLHCGNWDPQVLTYSSLADFQSLRLVLPTELFFFGETNFNLDNVSDGYFKITVEQSIPLWLPMQQSQMGKRFFL